MREELGEKETALNTLQKELDKEKYQHGQTEITKDKVIRDFTAYQKEMFSKESDLSAIPGYKKHIEELRAEVEKQDLEIADLTEELQRVKAQLRKKKTAMGEAPPEAISTRQAQSQQRVQLTLPLIAASLDPAVTSDESPETEPTSLSVMSEELEGDKGTGKQEDTQKTLNCSELTDYINQKFNPQKPILKQNIIDAASKKTKKMPQFESNYGFKFLGKIKGEYRFKILN